MHRQRNRGQPPGSRRAAAHPQRNPVLHLDRKRHNRPVVFSQQILVDFQNQIVFKPSAPLGIASRGRNRKLRRRPRPRSPDRNPAPRRPRQSPGRDWPTLPAGAASTGLRKAFAASLIPRCPSARPAPLPASRPPPPHCAAALQSPPLCPGLFVRQQRSAMEVDGVVGILQRVPGQHQHHRLIRSNLALLRAASSAPPASPPRPARSPAPRRPAPPWQSQSPPRSHPGTSRPSPESRAPPCATRPDCRCESPSPACAPPPAPARRRDWLRQAAHQRIGPRRLNH